MKYLIYTLLLLSTIEGKSQNYSGREYFSKDGNMYYLSGKDTAWINKNPATIHPPKTNCFGSFGIGGMITIALDEGFSIDSNGVLVYKEPVNSHRKRKPVVQENGEAVVDLNGDTMLDDNLPVFRPLKEEDVPQFITKTYQEYRLISAARDIIELFEEYVASDFKDSANTFTYWDWDPETKRYKGKPSYWIEPKPCFEGFIEYLRTK
jgi:hypothetical protein